MKRYTLIILSFLTLFASGAAADVQAAGFDYTNYEQVLKTSVRQDGVIDGVTLNVVDYGLLRKDSQRKDSAYSRLLEQMAAFDPAALGSREEKMAFWINVYNIAAIKTIVDHYPVDSIRSRRINWLGLPWNRKVITVGGREYALGEIEFDVLVEGFRDLRVHFGINCASVSCVDLLPEPYQGDRLSLQLEAQGKQFLADHKKGLRIDRERNTVYLSQSFKFDKKHFDAYAGGTLQFILPYLSAGDRTFLESGKPDVGYLDYNWKANDTANLMKE